MIKINRFTDNENVTKTCDCFNTCQASFNNDGNIVLRNYNSACKEEKNRSDEIIILSRQETEAIFGLVRTMAQVCGIKDLPF